MTRKEVKGLGMPWEDEYGYAQAVKVDDTIYISGQLSHDDGGNLVGAAPPDMEAQMRQTYANAKKTLGQFGAALRHRHGPGVRRRRAGAQGSLRVEKPGGEHDLVTPRLALPEQLVEIKFVAG
jgi:hypothetical protein